MLLPKRVKPSVRFGHNPSLDTLINRVRLRMRQDYANSRKGIYRCQQPKRTVGLVEHELNEPISNAEWKANRNNVENCLRNFHQSPWLEIARNLPPQNWLLIDQMDYFYLEGIKVFAGPDFAFRQGEGVVLVDWKTGHPRDEDQEQVQGYALYAQTKWKCHPKQVTARLVYLPTPEGRHFLVMCIPLAFSVFDPKTIGLQQGPQQPAEIWLAITRGE
jgi:hypothetical protein